jgi:hypothetical protein
MHDQCFVSCVQRETFYNHIVQNNVLIHDVRRYACEISAPFYCNKVQCTTTIYIYAVWFNDAKSPARIRFLTIPPIKDNLQSSDLSVDFMSPERDNLRSFEPTSAVTKIKPIV